MHKTIKEKQLGFSTVEILISIIIAGLFIAMFYQLYASVNAWSGQASRYASVSQITYAKLQSYEIQRFSEILVLTGEEPSQIEDFSSEFDELHLGDTVNATVSTVMLTSSLKAVNVKTEYGSGERLKVVEYTTYIQQSGVGR